MTKSTVDKLRYDFLSEKSKLQTISLFEELVDREATTDEIKLIVTLMVGQTAKFFINNSDIKEAQTVIASIAARRTKKTKTQPVRENYYRDGYYTDEANMSDQDDEPIQDILRREIQTTSETNAVRTRRDVDWGSEKYQKKVDFDNLALSHCRAFMGWKNRHDFVQALNPSAMVRTFPTLTLDTRNRSLVDDNAGNRRTMHWAFYNNSRWSQGAVNGLGTIRDIVGIECGTIYFPNIDDHAFTEYRQITMFIHEFSEQASILSDKVRYHFIFNAELISGDSGTERLKLVPAFSDIAETRFDRPITTLNALTISFGSPGERINFGYDRDMHPISVSAANPAVFTTSINHGLNNGDLVYIEGFTTDNPTRDNTVINLTNREKGHVIQSVTNNTFEIAAINTSSVSGQTLSTIIFGSRRFFIPLKFRYLSGNKQFDDEGY